MSFPADDSRDGVAAEGQLRLRFAGADFVR
jgi:hypothetical protein